MLLLFSVRVAERPSGKELFILLTVYVFPLFRERLSVCVRASFPFGFEGVMFDLIVIIPD